MRRGIWCTVLLASGCGISVVGTDPAAVDIGSTPDGSASVADTGTAFKDGALVDHDDPIDTDPEDATFTPKDSGVTQTFACNGSACASKCCVDNGGKLTCEAACQDWEIGCRTSTECGSGRVCCFDAQRRSRCATSCGGDIINQRVCVPSQNDCPASDSCIQATCYDAPVPFGTCQPNSGGGQIIANNCRFRG